VHDRSKHFQDFLRDLLEDDITSTLPLILHHKHRICNLILSHLKIKGSLTVITLVDLLAVLAKDLRQEFYPELFTKSMTALVELLNPKFPDLLEAVFTCICYLFKFLTKNLMDDLEHIVQ
jgi:U3 small nucleolar RNA-associated protein 20